jgi:uncharacterized protein YybS (DUF2232 family)
MWLVNRKKKPQVIKPVDPVVDEAKQRTHEAAKNAKQSADRLNKVFTQNGITLNILRAAGGRDGH